MCERGRTLGRFLPASVQQPSAGVRHGGRQRPGCLSAGPPCAHCAWSDLALASATCSLANDAGAAPCVSSPGAGAAGRGGHLAGGGRRTAASAATGPANCSWAGGAPVPADAPLPCQPAAAARPAGHPGAARPAAGRRRQPGRASSAGPRCGGPPAGASASGAGAGRRSPGAAGAAARGSRAAASCRRRGPCRRCTYWCRAVPPWRCRRSCAQP